jgi:steroid delta-isomerase-like uncharacterized protein
MLQHVSATDRPLVQAPQRPDLAIDWHIPDPRPGWRGSVDRFFGPGQTRDEVTVLMVGIAVLGALIALLVARSEVGLSWWRATLLGVFAFDALGGVLTNATGPAKRWYHRPGTRAERLRFVSLHVGYLAVLALGVLHHDWAWLTLNTAILIGFAPAIEYTPLPLRRELGMGLLVAAVLLNQLIHPLPNGLSWIPVLLYLKLFISHLLPEAPFATVHRPNVHGDRREKHMSTAQATANKAVVSRFHDAANTGDAEVISKTIDEVVEPDLLFHAPVPTGATGVQALKQVWEVLLRAFPDLHVAVEDVIAEGNKVVARNTVTGTHHGEYRGLPPTGKPVTYNEIFVFRFTGGRIAEIWGVVDVLSQMRQLGAIPA